MCTVQVFEREFEGHVDLQWIGRRLRCGLGHGYGRCRRRRSHRDRPCRCGGCGVASSPLGAVKRQAELLHELQGRLARIPLSRSINALHHGHKIIDVAVVLKVAEAMPAVFGEPHVELRGVGLSTLVSMRGQRTHTHEAVAFEVLLKNLGPQKTVQLWQV
jgi:hypothetical protein